MEVITNTPPYLKDVVSPVEVLACTTATFQVVDDESDTITPTISNIPSWVVYAASAGLLEFTSTPTAADVNSVAYSISFNAADAKHTTNPLSFDVLVKENLPPTVANPLPSPMTLETPQYSIKAGETLDI